jgi:hypothetical protein
MIRKQKVRDAVLNAVLMTTVSAHKLPLHNLCFEKQTMEIPKHRFVEGVIVWFYIRNRRKPELEKGLVKDITRRSRRRKKDLDSCSA